MERSFDIIDNALHLELGFEEKGGEKNFAVIIRPKGARSGAVQAPVIIDFPSEATAAEAFDLLCFASGFTQ
jgi:hypothetical protein